MANTHIDDHNILDEYSRDFETIANELHIDIDDNKMYDSINKYALSQLAKNNMNKVYYTSIFKSKCNELIHALCVDNKSVVDKIRENNDYIYTLPFLNSRDLYPSKWIDILKQIEYQDLKKNTMKTTDAYQCYKCKKNKIFIYERQTRSADEPMTIFFECQNCGNKWKK